MQALEDKMTKRGYLEGSEMATTFNMLRANDLIWSFVVNNYLLGNDPFPFDLLYWNADSTRMPARMHSFYLRKMYQENLLAKPNGDRAGRRADRPWAGSRRRPISCPRGRIISRRGGPPIEEPTLARRARSASCWRRPGHIAGVVNPPAGGKYGHWISQDLPCGSGRPGFAGATEMAGSWWPDWQRWVLSHDKEQVPARQPGDRLLPAIEDAPGSYVQVRLS